MCQPVGSGRQINGRSDTLVKIKSPARPGFEYVMFLESMLVFLASLLKNYIRFLNNLSSHFVFDIL